MYLMRSNRVYLYSVKRVIWDFPSLANQRPGIWMSIYASLNTIQNISIFRHVHLYKLFSHQYVPEINIIILYWCFSVDKKLYFFKGAFRFLWITKEGNLNLFYCKDTWGTYYNSCIINDKLYTLSITM